METVEKTTAAAGEIPIIVLTAHDDDADALRAVHRGAQDYLLKDEADGELLTRAIRYAIERAGFQRTLKEREARFRALVENSSDAITLLDEHFVAVYNSQAVERVCGYSPEELQGQPMHAHTHPDDLPELRRRFAECLANPGRPVHFEYRFRRKDGSLRWGEAVGVNRLDDPAVAAIVANHHDITERREAEAELTRRERYFRALTERASDLVVVLSTGGLVLYESPAIQRILGYAYGELTGRSVLDIVHPDDRERAAGLLATWSEEVDSATPFEFRVRHKSGEWRVLEALGRSLYDDPSSGIVVNARDITDRLGTEEALRRTEEQLRQAHKMEAVGRLAGGVAHDFNNVLTAIFGYVDLLLDRIDEADPRRADVVEIRRSAGRAAALTRQLLAFSRKQVMQPRVLDLNEVATSIQKLLQRMLGDDVQLVFQLEPHPWRVRADPGQLEQVLMNLAANSHDAMPEGGRFALETANTTLRAEDIAGRPGLTPGEYVLLAVADSGQGMPESVRVHVFEPFFTTKEQGKGTGLGLAMAYGIIKQTGGGIYVDSEEGKGTRVQMYLPRVP